jgi:hypothetical protein
MKTRRLTTHSTGARLSLPFIENLSAPTLNARPVNSGVRRELIFKKGKLMNRLIAELALYVFLLGTVTAYGANQDSTLKDTTESKYKVGQIWSYKTRPNEKKSSFIVLKVENHPKLGNIIHIALRDLKMKKPNGDYIETAGHLPFAEEAINRSAVKLLKEKVDLPEFEEGYGIWREAFDVGKAGIYTITIAEAVDVMETTLNQ